MRTDGSRRRAEWVSGLLLGGFAVAAGGVMGMWPQFMVAVAFAAAVAMLVMRRSLRVPVLPIGWQIGTPAVGAFVGSTAAAAFRERGAAVIFIVAALLLLTAFILHLTITTTRTEQFSDRA